MPITFDKHYREICNFTLQQCPKMSKNVSKMSNKDQQSDEQSVIKKTLEKVGYTLYRVYVYIVHTLCVGTQHSYTVYV